MIDNDDGNDTREVFEEFDDSRLRHVRTGSLPMPDNWEAACAAAQGEYVLYLEDKQAMHVRALETIHRVTEASRPGSVR